MLENILPDFQSFLIKRGLAEKKHVPFLARWVNQYLYFVNSNHQLDIYSASDDFIRSVALNNKIQDWQIRQAQTAIDIYISDYINSQDKSNDISTVADIDIVINKLTISMRTRNYSINTIKSYTNWITKFYNYLVLHKRYKNLDVFTQKDAKDYISFLAINEAVAPSTQNQAFNSLLYLFKNIIKKDFSEMNTTIRAKPSSKLPVVLTVSEIQDLIANSNGIDKLIIQLLYGTGMRLSELCKLRVKDVDFRTNTITVRQSKGDKDRTTVLPKAITKELKEFVKQRELLHQQDTSNGCGHTKLTFRLELKYPKASVEFKWQYLFASSKVNIDIKSQKGVRYYMSNKKVQTAIKKASNAANILKHVTVHTLRHSFATHLLQSGVNIREIQDLLGHKNLETTMIYTHVLRNMSNAPQSPLDALYNTT